MSEAEAEAEDMSTSIVKLMPSHSLARSACKYHETDCLGGWGQGRRAKRQSCMHTNGKCGLFQNPVRENGPNETHHGDQF